MVRKLLLAASAVCLSVLVQAQSVIINFERLPLSGPNTDFAAVQDTDVVYNFKDTSGVIAQHVATFYGKLENWGSYSGFNYSNVVNDTTAGFTNGSAAYAGSGAANSQKYVIAYGSDYGISFDTPVELDRVSYTNATYTGISMRDGDAYAKKFGGATGNDPDFFSVTVYGYRNGVVNADSVVFFLADFRDANNANDYIVKDWREVALRNLGMVDSLSFKFASSDVGSFGINTPLYFCLDNLYFKDPPMSAKNINRTFATELYPNPAVNSLRIEYKEPLNFQVFDVNGKVVLAAQNSNTADISKLAPGNYFIKMTTLNGDKTAHSQFVKK